MAKRVFDVVVSCMALLILSPLLFVIAVAIKIDSDGPVLFKQERVGLNGQRFEIYKFRTMVANAANLGPNITTRNDPRITRVGAFLRRWYLDELPQLINVLKGEMSIVGPRPETPEYVDLYTSEQRQVLSVKPGMAGLATIVYRNEEQLLAESHDPEAFYIEHVMPERLKLELEYVKNQSLLYDLKLLAQMVWVTLVG